MEPLPYMTVHECCEAFRANCIPMSEGMLSQLILEGKLPFAVGTRAEGSSRAKLLIFRRRFYEWLDAMIPNAVKGV